MRERLAARVQSTHAVKVYDARSSICFGPYLVMERLDGESLQTRLDRTGALPVDETGEWWPRSRTRSMTPIVRV